MADGIVAKTCLCCSATVLSRRKRCDLCHRKWRNEIQRNWASRNRDKSRAIVSKHRKKVSPPVVGTIVSCRDCNCYILKKEKSTVLCSDCKKARRKETDARSGKKYRDLNKDKKRKATAQYYRSNKKAIKNRNAVYVKNRLKNDHAFRLSTYTRNLIYRAVKRQYSSKATRSALLIGMSGKDFMQYLLSHENNRSGLFTEDNYGSFWHVDHIKPLAAFDLTNDEEQRMAFHWSNCQPLEADENMAKNSYWNGMKYFHKSLTQHST